MMTDQAREAVGVGLRVQNGDMIRSERSEYCWFSCACECARIWIYNNKAIMNSKIALGPVGNTKIDNSKLAPMQHLSK